MSQVDLDKLRSIGFRGKTAGQARIRRLEGEGKTTGFEVDYNDGRVEAIVRPGTIRVTTSLSTGEVVNGESR